MAAGDGGQDASYGGQPFDSTTLAYPAFSSADFHSYPADCPESNDSIDNWLSYTDVTQCRLDGLPDLATETTSVRGTEAAYLNSMISEGVDGFRLDSATEIGETDIAAIEGLLAPDTSTGLPVSITQEVYPGSSGQDARLDPTSFEPEGAVTSFDYSYALTDDFQNGDIAALNSFSPQLPSANASSFVTNQDTERASPPTLDYTDGAQYIQADEYLLAYGYGTPQIFSSFEFSSFNQAPPDESNGSVTNTACGTGTWECTEQNPAIDAMVGWHNLAYTDHDTLANWSTDGSNLIAFSQGTDAWIAINNGSSALTDTFTTGLANATYCDIINDAYSGGACSGPGITVAGGQATVTVPAHGSIAFDVDSQITGSGSASASASADPAPSGAVTETFTVTVPSSTPPNASVYLAGNLSVLGEGQTDWAANGVLMTKVSSTQWSATVHAAAPASLQYKYTLNGTWSNNEETTTCGYVANRSASIDNGTDSDAVANWEGYGGC